MIYRAVITMAILLLPALGIFRPAWAGYAGEPVERLQTTAIVNVHLVPMTEETVLKDQVLLVRGRRIVGFGPAETVDIPEGTVVIDGQGGWLMPGLADMHMHTRPDWLTSAWPVNPLKIYLAHGVTTIRCFGPGRGQGINPAYVLNWRSLIAQGLLDGPVLYTSGPTLYGPVTDPVGEVLRQKAGGYDFIKLYSYLTPREFALAMETAKSQGMYVAGHIPLMLGLKEALTAGLDEIAHVEELAWEMAPFDRGRRDLKGRQWIRYVAEATYRRYQDELSLTLEEIKTKYRDKLLAVAEEVKRSGAVVSTTLFLDQLIVEKLFQPDDFLKRPGTNLLPKTYLDAFHQGREKHQVQFKDGRDYAPFKRNLDLALLWALKEKGVPVLAATDAGTGGMGIVPGYTLHDELRLLVANGYTPYQALTAATSRASRVVALMTGRDEFGIIAPGRRADLLLVGGNPLADVAQARDIRGVMASGRWYGAEFIRSHTAR